MPTIVVKDYTWRQTQDSVIIQVPISGHPKKVDLFAIDNYVKASFPPFIFELFLWANIVEDKSNCTLTDHEVVFSLQKQQTRVSWPSLIQENINKEIKNEYRSRALQRAQALAEERLKAKTEKRQLLQNAAVKAQINTDTATLNKIDAMRDSHRKEAMRELEDWKQKAEVPFLPDIQSELQENRKAYRPPLTWFKDEDGNVKSIEAKVDIGQPRADIIELQTESTMNTGPEEKKLDIVEVKEITESPIPTDISSQVGKGTDQSGNSQQTAEKQESSSTCSSSEDSDSDSDNDRRVESSNQKGLRPGQQMIEKILRGKPLRRNTIFHEPSKSVPLPRKSATINVQFSERAFPTPARESAHLEEQEWLQKQAEARRKTGFAVEDLRPEERDPQWLKNKGDEFFKVGNYLAAVSAYSFGIKISSKMASLYVNRSAAHYALGNYYRCTEDCTTALELMEPKCESNRESRAKCHARRGAALCKLSAPQHGIPEFEAALKLTPNDESIKRDLLAVKQYFNMQE